MTERTCKGCGIRFFPRQPKQPGTYCSRPCGCRHRNKTKKGEPFERKYVVDHETGCWNWIRGKDKDGYGKHTVTIDGKTFTVRAHAHSFIMNGGVIPDGKVIDHLCRNTSCVNPDHMEPVTNAENIRRGNGAKLTSAQVETIRRRYASESVMQSTLAREYGVAVSAIHKIVTGQAWISEIENPVITTSHKFMWKRRKHVNSTSNQQTQSAAPSSEGCDVIGGSILFGQANQRNRAVG